MKKYNLTCMNEGIISRFAVMAANIEEVYQGFDLPEYDMPIIGIQFLEEVPDEESNPLYTWEEAIEECDGDEAAALWFMYHGEHPPILDGYGFWI